MQMRKACKRAKALIMEDYNYTMPTRLTIDGTLGENNVYYINSIYKENMSVCILELDF